MIRDVIRRGLSALACPALAATAVCGTATACASSKCGPYPINASVGGESVALGSCDGELGVPVAGRPEELKSLRSRAVTVHVGQTLMLTYHSDDVGHPHGAAVTDTSVARVETAPSTGRGIAVVVGVSAGSTLVTVAPTAYCGGDTVDRCAIAAVTVTAG